MRVYVCVSVYLCAHVFVHMRVCVGSIDLICYCWSRLHPYSQVCCSVLLCVAVCVAVCVGASDVLFLFGTYVFMIWCCLCRIYS